MAKYSLAALAYIFFLITVPARAAVDVTPSGYIGDPWTTCCENAKFDHYYYDPSSNIFSFQLWTVQDNFPAPYGGGLFPPPNKFIPPPSETYRIVLTFENQPLAASSQISWRSLSSFYIYSGGEWQGAGGEDDDGFPSWGFPEPAQIAGNSIIFKFTAQGAFDVDEFDLGPAPEGTLRQVNYTFTGPVEIRAQLRPSDFGTPFWLTVSSVPEPATWAMLIFGFGGVGVLLRRRRSAIYGLHHRS